MLRAIPGVVTAKTLTLAADVENGWTALHDAAAYGCLDQIENGVTASQLAKARCHADPEGWTALHEAAKRGTLEQMKGKATVRLLAKARDDDGYTALHAAAAYANLDQVSGRITAEQLLQVSDDRGYTVLSDISTSQIELLDGGATCEQLATPNRYGGSPLSYLAAEQMLSVVRGGVTAPQLASAKDVGLGNALCVALQYCPLDQITGGIPANCLSQADLDKVLASTLKFEGFNALEIVRLGGNPQILQAAIVESNLSLVAGQVSNINLEISRLRFMLRLCQDLRLSTANLVDPAVTRMLL